MPRGHHAHGIRSHVRSADACLPRNRSLETHAWTQVSVYCIIFIILIRRYYSFSISRKVLHFCTNFSVWNFVSGDYNWYQNELYPTKQSCSNRSMTDYWRVSITKFRYLDHIFFRISWSPIHKKNKIIRCISSTSADQNLTQKWNRTRTTYARFCFYNDTVCLCMCTRLLPITVLLNKKK